MPIQFELHFHVADRREVLVQLVADLNGDRRPDLVVSHIGDQASRLRNESPPQGSGLTLRLIGVSSNRSAVATRIEVDAGGRRLVRHVINSEGYLSGSTADLHIGIGDATTVDSLSVFWTSGRTQVLRNVPGSASLILVEGRSPISMR